MNMLAFKEVREQNIDVLADLASGIWHEYWVDILSPAQIDYMVEKFQSSSAIQNQVKNENYRYYFITVEGINAGYFGVSFKKDYLFLSKLYIKKDYRHSGIGTKAFEKIKEIAVQDNYKSIQLTVNKYNKNTIKAYDKWGFKTIDSVVSDIGSGFVMDDYIMEFSC